jgi:hypothetical protein
MQTQKSTMIAMIAELLESHMQKCSDPYPPDSIPHVLSEEHGTQADIDTIESNATGLKIKLSDGTVWSVRLQQESGAEDARGDALVKWMEAQ